MFLRPTLAIVAVALLLTACSSGSAGSVPSDQVIAPTKAPAGWTTTDLGPVKVAAPAAWTKGETTKATATVSATTWRAPEVDGTVSSGMEVKVISKPQQAADKAAQSLAVSAMAQLKGGSIDPQQITWPEAAKAYYLDYEATPTTTGVSQPTYSTRTVVFDLADGRQVQVTALAAKGSTDAAAPKRALESVVLDRTTTS